MEDKTAFKATVKIELKKLEHTISMYKDKPILLRPIMPLGAYRVWMPLITKV